MLAHIFCQDTHANAGEIVDGESSVTRVFCREKTLETGAKDFISETRLQARQTEMFSQILEQDLDEDSTTRRSFFLIHVDDTENVPSDGIVADHMSEETRDVPQAVCFIAVNSVIIVCEGSLKEI